MKHSFAKWIALSLVILMALSLGACSNGADNPVEEKKTLVLGCSADFPPYEFLDISSGTPVIAGFDIALGEEICKDLGVELEIKDMDFNGLLAAMKAGNIDIVISGMNATEERKKEVLFSDEYYYANQCVLIRKDDADLYKTIADFSGKTVGAQTGSIQEGIVNDQFVTEGASIFTVQSVQNLVLELKSKRIEGLVLDLPIAEAFVRQHDDLTISDAPVVGEDSGFAVAMPLGADELAKSINATLKRLKDEGKIDEMFTAAVELAEKQEAQN